MTDLISLIISLLVALFRIANGQGDAVDIASKAFDRGAEEMQKYWKEQK